MTDNRAAVLVIVRGLPGSGKTTYARKLASDGYTHCEADQYFERAGTYQFDPAKLREAHADCLARATESLQAGNPTVVSNTFTQRWEWSPYTEAAECLGVPVRFVECQGSYGSIHNVPAESIRKMRERWEHKEADVII